jgi:sugar phosphate isomerase/epimerase
MPERMKRLEKLAKSYPFRYTVHGLVSSDFMDPDYVDRQLMVAKVLVEVCDRIGARVLVQHSGRVRADIPLARADCHRREADALRELAEHARPYGVRIALENIFTASNGEYRKSPKEVAATIREIDHPNLCATLDFGHAYIECKYRGLDFMDEIRAMAPVTGHLHVHDCYGNMRGPNPFYYIQDGVALGLGDLHLPLGWGDIRWEEIFCELKFLPDTALMMEISNRRFGAEQPESLARARKLASLVNNRA